MPTKILHNVTKPDLDKLPPMPAYVPTPSEEHMPAIKALAQALAYEAVTPTAAAQSVVHQVAAAGRMPAAYVNENRRELENVVDAARVVEADGGTARRRHDAARETLNTDGAKLRERIAALQAELSAMEAEARDAGRAVAAVEEAEAVCDQAYTDGDRAYGVPSPAATAFRMLKGETT